MSRSDSLQPHPQVPPTLHFLILLSTLFRVSFNCFYNLITCLNEKIWFPALHILTANLSAKQGQFNDLVEKYYNHDLPETKTKKKCKSWLFYCSSTWEKYENVNFPYIEVLQFKGDNSQLFNAYFSGCLLFGTPVMDNVTEDDDDSVTKPLGRCSVIYYGVGHMLNDITASCWFTYLLLFLTDIGLSPRYILLTCMFLLQSSLS